MKTAAEIWDLWLDDARSPAMNMAVDESLLNVAVAASGRPLLRFYAWDRPAASIGYVQKFAAAPADGRAVVRRPTGGGVVLHDHDITYSVAAPAGHWLCGLDRMDSYGKINSAVRRGLELCRVGASLAEAEIPRAVSRDTMVCFQHPTRYDILREDGRKIAGSAQRRTARGILHQGSVLLGPALPLARGDIVAAICRGFTLELGLSFAGFTPAQGFLDAAVELAAARYETDTWNRAR